MLTFAGPRGFLESFNSLPDFCSIFYGFWGGAPPPRQTPPRLRGRGSRLPHTRTSHHVHCMQHHETPRATQHAVARTTHEHMAHVATQLAHHSAQHITPHRVARRTPHHTSRVAALSPRPPHRITPSRCTLCIAREKREVIEVIRFLLGALGFNQRESMPVCK